MTISLDIKICSEISVKDLMTLLEGLAGVPDLLVDIQTVDNVGFIRLRTNK